MPSRQRPPRRRCTRHLAAHALWLMVNHWDCHDKRSQVTRWCRIGDRFDAISSYSGSSMVAGNDLSNFSIIFPSATIRTKFRVSQSILNFYTNAEHIFDMYLVCYNTKSYLRDERKENFVAREFSHENGVLFLLRCSLRWGSGKVRNLKKFERTYFSFNYLILRVVRFLRIEFRDFLTRF